MLLNSGMRMGSILILPNVLQVVDGELITSLHNDEQLHCQQSLLQTQQFENIPMEATMVPHFEHSQKYLHR